MALVERYRDRWIVVVDKPAGLPSQPARGGSDAVITRLQREGAAYLHHRLDAAASGLLLVSLHADSNAALTHAFRTHAIDRRYVAVLDGHATDAVWTTPVDRKPARTTLHVVGHGGGASAARFTLHTGRRHQLRVHAAMAGHPILGDRRYGGDIAARCPRLALHAERLAFAHPVTGEALTLFAPLPDDLALVWREAGGDPSGG